jgi:hypothetical protein
MSESQFYAEQLAKFHQEHPKSAGWSVCEGRPFCRLELDGLPDFIVQAKSATAVKTSVTRSIFRDSVKAALDGSVPEAFKNKGWIGDIAFAWKKSPIHARSVRCCADWYLDRSVVFLATRSRSALESLMWELRDFLRRRMQEESIIKVVGGPDVMRPQLAWDDLCLPNGMGEDIRAASETFFRSQSKYRRFGLAYRRGFLFSGPPGCGKTQTAKVIASTIKEAACISYTAKDGDQEPDQLQEAFAMAGSLAPAILLLEDLDKIGNKVPVSLVVNLLDGLENPQGVLIIASTNEPEKLDPALLLRPSRFDRVWTFPLPEQEQRRTFLARKCGRAFSGEAIEEVARLSQGFSMAYVQEILASAVAYSVRDDREPAEGDLIEAVKVLRKQIKESRSALPRIGQPNDGMGFRVKAEA